MREKLILDMLKSKENVCVKSMASMLNVSDRTVRTEINLLNKSGEINGFKVINIRGKGYSLKINNDEKFNKYIKKMNSFFEADINFGLEERTNKILEILLISNDYITIDYIAEVIGYSRSTIIKDLEAVEKKLKFLGLDLKRKSNFGLKIINDEITIRKSLSTYLYSNNRDLLIENERNLQTFGKIKKIFIEEIVKNKIKISNLAIENIFCHLKILTLRFNNKNFIELNEYEKCLDYRFEEIALKICNSIGADFNIEVPKSEVSYLASQIYYKSKVVSQNDEIKMKAKRDIEDILENIDKVSYTNFSSDIELQNNLLIHLCALIDRARTNTQLKNPYFDEVNTRYSAIVSIVVNFTDEFCKRWNMNLLKDEIAFIAIHFATHFEKTRLKALKNIKKIAIVCPSDGGIEYFLKIRLEEVFGNTVIDNYTPFNLEGIIENKYDFLITNLDLNLDIKYPIFKINNLFDENELEDLVRKIEKDISVQKGEIEEKLDDVLFKRRKGGKDINYKNFLREEAKMLIKKDIVPEDFEELVLLREEKLSTAYKNNIAAPHGIEMNAKKNVLSVTIFDNPIEWGDKKITIVILIGMKKGSLNLHRVIANKLFRLINDEEERNEISKCQSSEDFIKAFKI